MYVEDKTISYNGNYECLIKIDSARLVKLGAINIWTHNGSNDE
jgi:hypothetical protein